MLDKTDIRILEELQLNSQISNQDLADKIALSPSPCSRRVKQLEDGGYIQQYVAILDSEKIKLGLTVLIFVGLDTHDPKKMAHFEHSIKDINEVLECHLIAGQSADYMLKVVAKDINHFQNFLLNKLTCIDGVDNVCSNFILRRVVQKTQLPLKHALSNGN